MSATSIQLEAIPAGTYNVDPTHSSVGFEVRHMGIATVRGAFKQFAGHARGHRRPDRPAGPGAGRQHRHRRRPSATPTSPRPTSSTPTPTRRSASARPAPRPPDDGQVRLSGEITIKGITKPLELTGVVADAGTTDPWGNERVGLELEGSIDRREFDLKWNQTLPNGNVLVSNQVKLVISVSAVKAS